MLTPEQKVRFQRQIRLPQIGAAGQGRLARARVAVVGGGGLGSLLSQIMVRMGVGRIMAIDPSCPTCTASSSTTKRMSLTAVPRLVPPPKSCGESIEPRS